MFGEDRCVTGSKAMLNLIAKPMKAAACLLIFVEQLIISLLNLFLKLFGLQMPVPSRQLPSISTTPSDILTEIQKGISEVNHEHRMLMKPTTEAGHVLYRFANAQSAEARAAMDLSALTPAQQNWLLMLSDTDLERLTKVGLDGCVRAISGKRCGIGGLPAMPNEKSVETPQPTTPLARRIAAYKQASFA